MWENQSYKPKTGHHIAWVVSSMSSLSRIMFILSNSPYLWEPHKHGYCLGGYCTSVETGCCHCSCVEVNVNQTFCLSVRRGCWFSPNTNSYCLLLGWWFWLHTLKAAFSSCLGFKLWVQTVSNGVLGSQLCRLNTRVEGAPPSWVGSLGSA